MNTEPQKIKAMLIGGVIGDALGVPYEFSPRDPNAVDMIGYGTRISKRFDA